MCCSSLTSAVNVVAIIATMRHLFGLGLGFFVCKSITAEERTELEKDIYKRLLIVSSSPSAQNGDIDKVQDVIFPWAVTLTTLAGIMILTSFAMMYANLRDGTQCLAAWLFLTIIDTVISPTTIGIYTFKYVENKIAHSDGEEKSSNIREISIFAGAMLTYYLMNLVLVGITWKRYVQIKQDNEQKIEEPYTVPLEEYAGKERSVTPRESFNLHEFNERNRSRNHTADSPISDYYNEDHKRMKGMNKYEDRWQTKFDERLSPDGYNESRRPSDNISAISDYDEYGRRNSYFDNLAMEPDNGWEKYGRNSGRGYPSSEISFGRRFSLYPGSEVASERRFSMYPAIDGSGDKYPKYYYGKEPPRKLSSYAQNDLSQVKKNHQNQGNEPQRGRRMSLYPMGTDYNRRQSAYFGDRSPKY